VKSTPQFDRYATTYGHALNSALSITGEGSDFYAEARIRFLVKLLHRVQERRIATILDFGCGTGSSTPFLRTYFSHAHIKGVDVSPESILVARDRFAAERATFDVLESHEAQAIRNVDLAFVNGVFHHILPVERDRWLTWILERLAPDGVLALFENNPWNPGTRFVMSRCEFDQDAVCLSYLETSRRMRNVGFQILTVRNLLFFPAFLRFLRPIEPYLSRIPIGGQYICLGRKKECRVARRASPLS
jgi:SAM-dependent methyltransferase